MAKWINHVAIAAPRNATTTHTVGPSSGTVVTGTLFTPTAGNLLVCVAEGAVTSTTPSGWTLPSGGSAINDTGLYVWYRTAAGGGDSFTTTHNGSDYPVVFDFYEFPAGSTFGTSTSAVSVSSAGGAGPTLSGLTGTNLLCAVAGQDISTGSAGTMTWSAGVEATDTGVAYATTDGYGYSLAYLEDSVLSSWSSAATSTFSGPTERLVFSVQVAAGGGLAPIASRAAGTSTAIAATATTLNPAVPAGTATGDLSVLCVEAKPYTTTITTPSGWTKIGEATNGTTASGVDTGSMKVAMYVKESATPGAIGAMTLTGADSSCAVIHSYSKDPTERWDTSVFTTGSDASQGTNYSATGGAIATAADDWIVCATAVNTDLGTTAVSAQTIGGMSGNTLGTVAVRTAGTADGAGLVTTGNDSRLIVVDRPVTAGSSSAAPTMTYTLAQTNSGTSIWLRLRATAPTSTSTALAVTATLTAAGVVGKVGDSALAVTATLTAAGTVTGPVNFNGAASLAVTAARPADGEVRTGSFLDFSRSTAAVEALATMPTITVTVQSGTTISGGTLIANTDPRVIPRQAGAWGASGSSVGPFSRYSYAYQSPPAWGFEFVHIGSVFELALNKFSASSMRIKVDGQRVQDLPELMTAPGGGANFVYKVDFGSSATRRITVEGQYTGYRGIYVNPATDQIVAPPGFDYRMIVAGDQVSVGLGPTINTGYGQGTWVPRLGDYANCPDPWNVAISGNTGYVTGVAGTTLLIDRITDVTNWNPQVVIVWNGYYDRAANQTTLRTAVDTYLSALQSGVPTAEIYVIGCWAPTDAPGATTHIPTDATIQAAALAAALPFISPITGNVYDAAGTLLGSIGPWVATAGDVTAYVSSDGITPSDAGHQHIAEMMRSSLILATSPPATNVNGDATLAVTATVTAVGTVGRVGDSTLPVTATLTAAGTLGKSGPSTTLAVTATLSADGVVGRSTGSSLPVTATLPAAGVLGKIGAAALPVTATLSADGSLGKSATSTTLAVTAALPAVGAAGTSGTTTPLAVTATLSAAGTVGTAGAANLAVTAALPAAGATNLARTSTTLAVTATVTADGVVARSTTSTSTAVTATLPAAGVVGISGAAQTLTVTAALPAAGSTNLPGGASTAVTASLTASGQVGRSGAAALPVTASTAAAGSTGLSGSSASTAVTASTPVSGSTGLSGSSALTAVTASLPAAGVAARSGPSTTLGVTATLSAAGTIGKAGDGNLAVTATLSAAGVVGKPGTATLPVTATLDAAGSAGLSKPTSGIAVTATLTATGTVTAGLNSGSNPVIVTAERTAAGRVDMSSPSTLPVTATLPAAGSTGLAGSSAALPVTATLTAGGVVGKSSGATLAVTASLTAAGTGGSAPVGATLPVTATLSAAGTIGKFGAANLAVTATLTAGAGASGTGSASLPVTATLTAAGVVGKSGGAFTAVGVELPADGAVGWTGGADLPVTATLTAGGVVPVGTGATLPVVATLTAAGTRSAPGAADLAVTATLTAGGRVGVSSGAETLAVTATLTVDASITEGLNSGAHALDVVASLPAAGVAGRSGTSAALTVTATLTATGEIHDAPMNVTVTGPRPALLRVTGPNPSDLDVTGPRGEDLRVTGPRSSK